MEQTKADVINSVYGEIAEAGNTPYILVSVDARTRVPMPYVKDGKIVLNISMTACHQLSITSTGITFGARFGGKLYSIDVPLENVIAIYGRENGEGVFFEPAVQDIPPMALSMIAEKALKEQSSNSGNNPGIITAQPEQPKRPGLRVVK